MIGKPAAPTPPPALDILARLSAADVRARLAALDAEREALLPLLRSLSARERALARDRRQREGRARD